MKKVQRNRRDHELNGELDRSRFGAATFDWRRGEHGDDRLRNAPRLVHRLVKLRVDPDEIIAKGIANRSQRLDAFANDLSTDQISDLIDPLFRRRDYPLYPNA